MINLMLVEDNAIVRQGLVKFLSLVPDISIVAQADDAAEAIRYLHTGLQIDIIMADWNMPEMDGLELTTHVRKDFPGVKIIILTMHSKQEYKDKAKAAGASGYILKDGEFDELIAAIRDVADGETVYT